MTSRAREQLADDHEAVHQVLQQVLTALKNNDVKASHATLDLLWARLAVHIRAEHLHLFPAVAGRLPEAPMMIENLRTDHDFFMRQLARAVGILRELSSPVSSAEREAGLASVLDVVLAVEKRLAKHNDLEENQVYNWATTLLTETEQSDLAARINAELVNHPPRFSVETWKNEL